MNFRNIFSKKESVFAEKKFLMIGGVVVLLVVLLIIFGGNLAIPLKNAKKNLGPEEAKAAAEKFINENLLPAGTKATVKSAVLEGDVYNISLDVAGQDYTSYMTRDGAKFQIAAEDYFFNWRP